MAKAYQNAFTADSPPDPVAKPEPAREEPRDYSQPRQSRKVWNQPTRVDADEGEYDDDEDGGTRRRWKKRGATAAPTAAAMAASAALSPPEPVKVASPTPPAEVRTREDDRMSRGTKSDRRTRAEDLLEQTKARYAKYLKDRNLEGKLPEDPYSKDAYKSREPYKPYGTTY